jgi:hypothetical protein
VSDDSGECPLCGGCGEVDATSATTPVPETVGCPVCIASEKDDRIAELEAQLAEARDRADFAERGFVKAWRALRSADNELASQGFATDRQPRALIRASLWHAPQTERTEP